MGNEQLLSLILQSFSSYKLIHVKFNLEGEKKNLDAKSHSLGNFLASSVAF